MRRRHVRLLDADEIDIPVIRKPPPPEPPVFVCRICNARSRRDRWLGPDRTPTANIICDGCTRHWDGRGRVTAMAGYSLADRKAVSRLRAINSAYQWEVMNGNGRWRRR